MKDNKILIGTALVLLLLLTTGLSYAYFSTTVKGNDTAKDMVVEAGTLKLTYTDGPTINVQNIKPGWTTTKTVSVKNNGTLDTAYNIVWQELTNTILKNELVLSSTCKRLNESGAVEGTCEPIVELPVRAKRIAKNISIESGFTHEYTFTFLFKETNESQNYNQGKQFNGVLGIEEYKDTAVYCTYDGELTQGATFTKGNFIYSYKQESYFNNGPEMFEWKNIVADGWGVRLVNRYSTTPIDASEVCTYINDKPIVSTSYMFFESSATTLNLNSFDTSKVTNMSSMFRDSQATTIDVSNFDTSNVTNMGSMFSYSKATTLDLSRFDTSNVTNMTSMFSYSQVASIDLNSFDTSKVTTMNSMFHNSKVTTLDVSNFDTSNVTNMDGMFDSSQATTLDVSNFDTSNVTNMGAMFSGSQATTLDVSNFDTSKVTNMGSMFSNSQATTLDVSNFDTSNVTNMYGMFFGSKVTALDLNSFDTSKVTNMTQMFDGSQVTILDLSSFDTSNVTNMSYMFQRANNLNTIYVSNKFNIDKVTQDSNMFYNCTNLVGGAGTKYGSTKIDKTYARIDGGTSSPGYFTAK